MWTYDVYVRKSIHGEFSLKEHELLLNSDLNAREQAPRRTKRVSSIFIENMCSRMPDTTRKGYISD